MNKLFLLTLKSEQGLHSHHDYNKKFVISAPTPARARKMASEKAFDEGPMTWENPELSRCKMIADMSKLGENIVCVESNVHPF